MLTIVGPETDEKAQFLGHFLENGSAIFLGSETDTMAQFLAPETDIVGERNFMIGKGGLVGGVGVSDFAE